MSSSGRWRKNHNLLSEFAFIVPITNRMLRRCYVEIRAIFGCKRVIVVVIIMSLLFLSACTEKYKQGKQQ